MEGEVKLHMFPERCYTGSMAHTEEGDLTQVRRTNRVSHEYNSFFTRYPDAMSWLNGSIWVLDLEEDINEPLPSFIASLRYQARVFGDRLVTHVRWQGTGDEKRRILKIQAVPKAATEPQAP